jgi:Putative peptidoglycan binding domain
MPDPVLAQGSNGPDVARLQDLLNRGGALLTEDGAFGSGTASALRDAQTAAGLAPTGVADAATWAALNALAEPCPGIATQAVAFLGQQEVSSRSHYDAVVCHPCRPGGDSGITIGVGYDLGQQTDFVPEWSPLLPAPIIDALSPAVGVKGDAAQALLAGVAALTIPWNAAWSVLTATTLPQTVAATRGAFPGFDDLSPLCRGVLVDLVYNRGTDMGPDPGDTQDRRLEMRQIRDALAANNPGAVPGYLRAMTRLWTSPAVAGVRQRRLDEATMFEQGLAG